MLISTSLYSRSIGFQIHCNNRDFYYFSRPSRVLDVYTIRRRILVEKAWAQVYWRFRHLAEMSPQIYWQIGQSAARLIVRPLKKKIVVVSVTFLFDNGLALESQELGWFGLGGGSTSVSSESGIWEETKFIQRPHLPTKLLYGGQSLDFDRVRGPDRLGVLKGCWQLLKDGTPPWNL